MNLIAVFLALRVDQNLVDMHSLNIVDMHIHDQDRLGSFFLVQGGYTDWTVFWSVFPRAAGIF